MNDINNKDQMLKDLQFIKEAVKKNNNIFKYISLSEGIKTIALFAGIIIISLSLIFLLLIRYYGGYQEIPYIVKSITYIILGASLVWLGWYKIKILLRIARKYRKDITFIKLLREVYTKSMLMIIIPFAITIGVVSIYLSIYNLYHLITPVLAILIALLMAAIIVVLNLKDFMVAFGWLLISGLFSLFIADKVHPLIILIITFGIAMIILYLSTLITILREKSD